VRGAPLPGRDGRHDAAIAASGNAAAVNVAGA